MKILNRKQFLLLPKGILYTKFEPCIFGDIAIKEDSSSNDWLYQHLLEIDIDESEEFATTLLDSIEKGTSFKLDYNALSRDGLYNDKQLFAVFEREDVVLLIERLSVTISKYPNI